MKLVQGQYTVGKALPIGAYIFISRRKEFSHLLVYKNNKLQSSINFGYIEGDERCILECDPGCVIEIEGSPLTVKKAR